MRASPIAWPKQPDAHASNLHNKESLQTLRFCVSDGRTVSYDFGELNALTPTYATAIQKTGSSLSGVGSPARKGCAHLFDRAAD
jgi:hypothetical protein